MYPMPDILGGRFTLVESCDHGMKMVSCFKQPRGHQDYLQLHATNTLILAPFTLV
jgi:hypothetical protein